jgi:hypothetical protein
MNRGMIYLLQPAILLGTNIYKIGCSSLKQGVIWLVIRVVENVLMTLKRMKKQLMI